MCLHQNLEEESQGLKSPQDHVINESIACRSELVDLNATLKSAFFRKHQQITTRATMGTGAKHVGLDKKGKIRVQVILNYECFHFMPKVVTNRARVGFMFRLRI